MSNALMYRIETTAPIITMTAKKDFTLAAKTVDIATREVVADAPVVVVAGTTLHFIGSSLPGWYYIGRVEHDHVSCSCPSRKPCKHMVAITNAASAKANRKAFTFRVAGKEAHGATAAEALLRALALVKPVVAPVAPVVVEAPSAEEVVVLGTPEMDKVVQELEEAFGLVEEVVAPVMSPECPEVLPTAAPSYAEMLQVATTAEERKAIWKRVRADERIRNKEAAMEYWAKVNELRKSA